MSKIIKIVVAIALIFVVQAFTGISWLWIALGAGAGIFIATWLKKRR